MMFFSGSAIAFFKLIGLYSVRRLGWSCFNRAGQIIGGYKAVFAQQHRPLDNVLKLTHVAGP